MASVLKTKCVHGLGNLISLRTSSPYKFRFREAAPARLSATVLAEPSLGSCRDGFSRCSYQMCVFWGPWQRSWGFSLLFFARFT